MGEFSTGAIFAGHRILGLAGRGGMGAVYRATRNGSASVVALKVIASAVAGEPGFRERFERESRLARSLDHPNIIPALETGEVDGCLFITMPFVEGRDLSEIVAEDGPVEPARAVAIVDQVAAALDAAHEHGLVHRDVKPANIRVGHDGRAYLTDFGLAKDTNAEDRLTATGQFVGTLDYASPEQLKCMPADARADVYSLGCVLFYSITGRRPYEHEADVATLFAHLSEPPPAPSQHAPGVPAGFDSIIARAMAKDPDDRFASAGSLAAAADAALEGTAPRGPRRQPPPAGASDGDVVTRVRELRGPRV